ncbi:uncharacterized protein N0V89_005682 [Didymosphaeria variabile]|uniref:DUF803-domain-containing protein n=1 Tax=Didymosphaeria variabile TaxID=1932322 RepID=A0A9W8XL66_9PLEO|nr:uncharacterized protein N0V89_005682 [Didymosphaeria variabile]KAJ4353950.1 hypothetical protein N0V89_005682 [Didymosphaeria variabile]
MMLPPTSVAAGPATTTSDAPSPTSTSLIPPYGSEQWNSFIGIITAIVGNVLISFALNTQRYAHIRLEREWQAKERQRKRRSASYRSLSGVKRYRDEPVAEDTASEEDPLLHAAPSRKNTGGSRSGLSPVQEEDGVEEAAYKQKSYLKSPYWWAGIIMMTCGEAGNFLAYGFAPASIVSPLGVVALISNCIIAPFMLKEPFRARDALGVLVAVGGAVTVVLSASDNNPKLGPDEIWSLISTWEFETYFGITVAVIIALLFASNRYGDKNILIDLGLVGLFGGYTALSTKGVASMLSYTLWRAITFPVTYLLVAILVGTAVMQIKYINRALQRFDATQVIPVQFVLFTLSVILGSAVLYRDFERTSGDDAGKFVGGCALTFLGVWLITSGRPKRLDEDEDRDPEPEDAINLVDGERYCDDVNGTNEAAGSSRRSSTVRATSPPINTDRRPPTREISQSASPDITFTPDALSEDPLTSAAALEVPSPLMRNPWEDDDTHSTSFDPRPAELSRNSTLSTPVLPSQTPELPAASTSSPELTGPPRPQTPVRQISDTAAIAPTPPSTLAQHRLRRIATSERAGSRNSVSGPLLASPLSNSLSAMVANLKRSGSLRGPPLQRDTNSGDAARRQSVLGIGADEVMDSHIGEPLDRRRTATDEDNRSRDEQTGGRARSLSGTLNELWRGWRGQSDGDLETGPRAPE